MLAGRPTIERSPVRSGSPTPRRRPWRSASSSVPALAAAELGFLAVVAYLPLLLTRPGSVAFDTFDGLYLQPRDTLIDAASRWDSGFQFGSFADRTYNHAFPMAPWFWATDLIGLPTWIAQRLWLGSLLFAGGCGVLVMLRTLQRDGGNWVVAAVAYQCSPYIMRYLGAESVVLLSWAALPWLIAFAAESFDRGSWRGPARFGVALALGGAGNVAGTVCALLGPIMWGVHTVVAVRETKRSAARRPVARMLLVAAAVLAWVAVSQLAEPSVDREFARAADPPARLADSTVISDTIRGVGDWKAASDTPTNVARAARDYQRFTPLVIATFAIPAIALVALARLRFRNRLFYAALVIVGAVLSSGAAAAGSGGVEPFGALYGWFVRTAPGALLAATHRAVPLSALGIAVCFAAAIAAMQDWRPRSGAVIVACGLAVSCMGIPAFFGGRALDGPLLSDGLPPYWRDLARDVSAIPGSFNALELPASSDSNYSWGTTRAPIMPTLLSRSVAMRLRGPGGQPATVDLLAAIDNHLRSETLHPRAVAPLARLMSVDLLLVQADEAAGVDRSEALSTVDLLRRAPGVVEIGQFGELRDGLAPVTLFSVTAVPERFRVVEYDDADVVAGSGDGLVALANAGLLDGDEMLVYASDLNETRFAEQFSTATHLYITDSARRREELPAVLQGSIGPTLPAAGAIWGGPRGRFRFPTPVPLESTSYVEWDGVRSIEATGYGSADRMEPADRPSFVADGDIGTGWRVGRNGDPVGHRITIRYGSEVSPTELVLRQMLGVSQGRAVREVRLEFDGIRAQTAVLAEPSEMPDGQTIALSGEPFRTMTVEILSVASGPAGAGAGFTEIDVAGIAAVERLVMPNDLMRFGPPSLAHPISIVMSRWRDPDRPVDPEPALYRVFELPGALSFDLVGEASEVPARTATIGRECQTGLVRIDGRDVAVRVTQDSGRFGIEGCDAIELGPGRHVLHTASPTRDPEVALAIDSLVLESAARTDVGVSGARIESAPGSSSAESLRIDDSKTPLWLASAVSASPGWRAELDRERVDESFLVNGFAAGWRLDVGDGDEHVVAVRFSTQRTVNIAVLLSLVAATVCALIALRREPPLELVRAGVNAPIRYLHPGVILFAGLGIFGLVGGAVPGLVAGGVAVLLEARPAVHRWLSWSPLVVLCAVAVGKAVAVGSDPVSWAPALDTATWTALALATTCALSTADRAPSPSFGV